MINLLIYSLEIPLEVLKGKEKSYEVSYIRLPPNYMLGSTWNKSTDYCYT